MRGVRKTGEKFRASRGGGGGSSCFQHTGLRCGVNCGAPQRGTKTCTYSTQRIPDPLGVEPSPAMQPRFHARAAPGGGAPFYRGSLTAPGWVSPASHQGLEPQHPGGRSCAVGVHGRGFPAGPNCRVSCRMRQTSSVTKRTHRERHRCWCSCAAHSRRDEFRRDRASWLGYCSITALLSSSRQATRRSCLAQACSTITQLLESMPSVSPCFLPMHATPTC